MRLRIVNELPVLFAARVLDEEHMSAGRALKDHRD